MSAIIRVFKNSDLFQLDDLLTPIIFNISLTVAAI